MAITVLCAAGCDISGMMLIDLLRLDDGKVLLVLNYNKSSHLLLYQDGKVEKFNKDIPLDEIGAIQHMVKLADGLIGFTTEKNGVYLLPLVNESGITSLIHIPVEEDALVENKIRDIKYCQFDNIRKLYVIYATPKGSGATEIILKDNFTPEKFNHLDTTSSELRSNNIVQIETDMKGNVWFNYSKKEEKGVSRLNQKGEWSHFDRNNSELPDKYVRCIRSEGANDGVDGDNVWFASVSGLTRLEYKPGEKDEEEKEKWKLYGERETTGGMVARALGLREYFSDAVLDIMDLHVTDKYLLISNRSGVFTFNGKSMNRFVPDTVGGLNETQISDINYRDGFVIVKTRPAAKQNAYVDSVQLLDIKKRKWINIKFWNIKRDYPQNISFIPYKKGIDLVALTYQDKNLHFAFFNYEKIELKKIELAPPADEQQAPVAENQKPVSEPEQDGPAAQNDNDK